ncbi:phosphotransferase [Nocardioides jiangxiensis]|uniref:Phosphotransferase n=1 Tax=Nocardioides jiangxiensis TaxID=3064524 RepID=A0ABT9B4E4_9ACTN|nr:phosphotransferase [Nocardioides sp. WY-20]MDO7869587.1 phosphotransferase [Nocardioides sp. WY-20]
MWQPEAHWERLPSGMGASTLGVWRDGDLIVKRLAAPTGEDPVAPHSVGWWRRQADVAASGIVESTPGLRGPAVVRVEQDGDGLTFWYAAVVPQVLPGPFVAQALGRFAGADLGSAPWLCRDQLGQRMTATERRGGWTTLARTTVADLADRLWQRRGHFLAALAELPQVAQHGDPVPANLLGRDDDAVLAIDWSNLGTGPVGSDLGYWSLSAREEFDVLLEAYVAGLPDGVATIEQARLGAQVTAVYTALSRADWALARAAEGSGALAAKYRHPSVAPYLAALQRQFPQLEALI